MTNERGTRVRRRERGQTLVEFAMVSVLLVTVIFGFIELGRLYNAWVTVQSAAREGVRYGVTGQSSCTGYADDRMACIQYQAKQRAKALTNWSSQVSVQVRSWDYPNYTAQTNNNAGQACDALEVEVDYTFKPYFFSGIFGVSVPLKGRERMVNEPFGTCQ